MRLHEVERGDTLHSRAVIRLISIVSGMRLPDAARVAFYHRDFVGSAIGEWTQAAMRGTSDWAVGERELMAAMVASWNSGAFCIGAHRAVAARGVEPEIVDACIADYRTAPISAELRVTLGFLEKMTLRPDELSASDVENALAAGVTSSQLADAAAVATLFNMISRYADALDFAIPSSTEFDKAAAMMLKRGYR